MMRKAAQIIALAAVVSFGLGTGPFAVKTFAAEQSTNTGPMKKASSQKGKHPHHHKEKNAHTDIKPKK